MRKGAIPILVWILAGIAVLAIPNGGQFFSSVSQGEKCVLQTDYNYIGCVEDPANQPVVTVSPGVWAGTWYQCPTVTSKCTVFSGQTFVCPTGNNCNIILGLYFSRQVSAGGTILPGEWTYAGSINTVMIQEHYTVLVNCGINTGTCANAAVFPVPGASFCQFNTNEKIYDNSGAIVSKNQSGAFAYTVQLGRAYAYPVNTHCIYVPTCNIDSDCVAYGQYQGIYNGMNVGYSINGQQLSVYGCNPNSGAVTVGKDVLGSTNLSMQTVSTGICAVKTSFAVQCQPGTNSCGANSFCKDMGNLQFKCQVTSQCTTNYDCGSQILCDSSTKKLKTPVCNSGSCVFNEQNVECCDYLNCPDGYYCSADRQCRQGGVTKVACPFQCCSASVNYIDKPCASGQECCPDGTCAGTGAIKQTCSGSVDNGAKGSGACPPIGICPLCFPDIICMLAQWWAAYGMYIIIIIILIIVAIAIGVVK